MVYMKIRKQLVPSNLAYQGNGTNKRKYITVHETANTATGANAAAHANLQSSGYSGASWHWTVDDSEAVQSYPNTAIAWHAGDGANGLGNTSSVGVEICVNKDGNYAKAVENAAQLVAQLRRELNIPHENVVQHNRWTGKNCPAIMRRQGAWTAFKAKVAGYYGAKTKPVAANTKPTVKVDGKTVPAGTAAQFKVLAAAFKKATGLTLHVRDGLRTTAEQRELYNAWKAGTFSAPSVAPPGTSLHESGRALDIYDSGRDAGVTVAGNRRSNWIKKNAAKYGFNPTGYEFREPWHVELQKQFDPWGKPKLTVDGCWGASTTRALQRLLGTPVDGVVSSQPVANRKYGGALVGGWQWVTKPQGSTLVRAIQKKFGAKVDGLIGPATIRAIQKGVGGKQTGYLAGKNGSKGVKLLQKWINNGGKK